MVHQPPTLPPGKGRNVFPLNNKEKNRQSILQKVDSDCAAIKDAPSGANKNCNRPKTKKTKNSQRRTFFSRRLPQIQAIRKTRQLLPTSAPAKLKSFCPKEVKIQTKGTPGDSPRRGNQKKVKRTKETGRHHSMQPQVSEAGNSYPDGNRKK